MNRLLSLIAALVLATNLAAQDVTYISTAQELRQLAEDWNDGTLTEGTFRLNANIDLSGENWTPIGTTTRPFTASLDGQGHWVSNLTVFVPGALTGNTAGLFGCIGEGGLVTRVGVASGTVRVDQKSDSYPQCYSGGLAGLCRGSIIQCANAATIYGNLTQANVGGIAGELSGTGLIQDCYNLGRLYTSESDYNSKNKMGGIVGHCDDGAIHSSYSSAVVEKAEYHKGGAVADETFDVDIENVFYNTDLVSDGEDETYYGRTQAQMIGHELDGQLNNAQGDYTVWTFAEGRMPQLGCLPLPWGDVNLDGQVSIADVTYLVNILLGKTPVNFMSDVNRDGQVSIADVTYLVNILLGKAS